MSSIKRVCLTLVAALLVFVSALPVHASGLTFAFVSSTGNDSNPCTAAQPCATIPTALIALTDVGNSGQVSCIDSPSVVEGYLFTGGLFTIDCQGAVAESGPVAPLFQFANPAAVVKIRNLTFNGEPNSAPAAIVISGGGTLILENCVFENFSGGTPLQIQPNGPFNLVVINSRFSNSTSGVLIEPTSGGSVKATFDRVTITQNSGGGIKINTTSGPVTVDITASTISDNTGNGLNAVSGAGGAAIFNVEHSVIADNGDAGIQANGSNAAALVDTTLLDSNGSATNSVSSGKILTYGTNRIVGSSGSGFTGSASLQ
jgi:hypothetical protein